MARRLAVFVLGFAALGATLGVRTARADAIDGNWCFTDGKSFSIRGPEIVTPKGARVEGTYGRHSFVYQVPASEPGGGATVSMVLLDEDTVELTRGSGTETWRRCEKPVS